VAGTASVVVVVGGNVVVVVELEVVVVDTLVVDELVVVLDAGGEAASVPQVATIKAMPIKMGRRLTSQLRSGRQQP